MAYVDELAARLDADLSRKVGEYSSVNRQTIGLIQASMHKPALLILDEPNSGLDPLMQQTLQEILREVRGEGPTVFLSSHTEVDRVADRVGIIRHGRLVVVERADGLKRTRENSPEASAQPRSPPTSTCGPWRDARGCRPSPCRTAGTQTCSHRLRVSPDNH